MREDDPYRTYRYVAAIEELNHSTPEKPAFVPLVDTAVVNSPWLYCHSEKPQLGIHFEQMILNKGMARLSAEFLIRHDFRDSTELSAAACEYHFINQLTDHAVDNSLSLMTSKCIRHDTHDQIIKTRHLTMDDYLTERYKFYRYGFSVVFTDFKNELNSTLQQRKTCHMLDKLNPLS